MSPLFFVTFIMLGAMIVINLLVGVMITSLEEANQEQIEAEKKLAIPLLHETESHLEEKLEELHDRLQQVQATLDEIRQKPQS